MNTTDPYDLDKQKVRASFDKAAAGYEQVAVLQQEVGKRLVERLEVIRNKPASILDLGCGCGATSQSLTRYAGNSLVSALDISETMLRTARGQSVNTGNTFYVGGDMENVPFADHSFDMLFSNLSLQWCNDVGKVFQEFARLLRPGGLVMFTTFGPETLRELRASWANVDSYTHVNGFVDLHHYGDALLQVGLAEPVMDAELFTLTYSNTSKLMADLKDIGAHNLTAGRPRGLTGKGRILKMEQAYETYRQDGVLPATYEVIYGHAWAPAPSTAEIPIGQIK